MSDAGAGETMSAWAALVEDLVPRLAREVDSQASLTFWRKSDGSQVSDLDLRIDTVIRVAVEQHYPGAAVLSEEVGLLRPQDQDAASRLCVIVDPIDGTESLASGLTSWWTAIGLFDGSTPLAGLIYQPLTSKVHDSTRPSRTPITARRVGMSPDQLTAQETLALREILSRRGAALDATPHSVEKVASVLEGRRSACLYLPSRKSPGWHSWDLAACVSIAASNGLELRTLDGEPVRVSPSTDLIQEGWICAADEVSWTLVRDAVLLSEEEAL